MGNGVSCRVSHCFSGRRRSSNRHVAAAVNSEPLDEGLGHSFCYVSSKKKMKMKMDEPSSESPNRRNFFFYSSISGASVSANNSTALSTSLDPYSSCSAAAFDCSNSFASVPLRPVDRGGTGGFLSGPIERIHFLSAPLDDRHHIFSGPIVDSLEKQQRRRRRNFQLLRSLSTKSKTIKNINPDTTSTSSSGSSSIRLDDTLSSSSASSSSSLVQWAQGRAGEDRVHVVVSEEEEDEWVFVGIYDGFNGPDATDYLLSNLYQEVRREIHGCCCCRGGNDLPEVVVVLKALSRALKKTEAAYFDVADRMSGENPELALMGSCVLVMLMKGKDVYLMNVGDSRAVLGRRSQQDEDTDQLLNLKALQLTMDHSTSVEKEVVRIRNEHPDDSSAIANDRVKGSLKVTRAFGAGFLKKPKWNDAVVEMLRIDYVGRSPYITCDPYLYHHTLSPTRDRFLILSSDGLYDDEYFFSNDEAVAEVELFLIATPEGDPAQHLVEELLFRAANKAGMDFHELLAIPQGDRRRYHDDVSVIVISFQGRIWRSCLYT